MCAFELLLPDEPYFLSDSNKACQNASLALDQINWVLPIEVV